MKIALVVTMCIAFISMLFGIMLMVPTNLRSYKKANMLSGVMLVISLFFYLISTIISFMSLFI